ncbi:MAG: FAD-dependent oxidoreductase, partial [Deltaproteobacteria bacterium]|nr:FAD-dependent oxidoreductase [Deltaproteobacteria bacterium]
WRARPAPKPDGSFDDWILAQFGAGVADLFMRPYNRKVWRVDPTEMSATWVEDRVAGLSAEVIARGSAPSTGWGPNARFRYPRRGGTGAIWQGLAAQLPGGWLQTNAEVVEVRPEAKVLRCQGPLGARWLGYDVLINTSPLDAFVARLGGLAADPVRRAAARLRYTSTHVIGLGLRGRCPEALADKTWIYLPASEPPVHRVTVFSAYSDDHVPEPGRTWSLLCEASETQGERQSPRSIVAATVRGLEALGWLRGAEVESTWHRLLVRGYPVPTRERDALLDTILPWLEARQIYSRGRFGQWRYELGNQDHSYMQGVELVDRLLLRAEEGARAS